MSIKALVIHSGHSGRLRRCAEGTRQPTSSLCHARVRNGHHGCRARVRRGSALVAGGAAADLLLSDILDARGTTSRVSQAQRGGGSTLATSSFPYLLSEILFSRLERRSLFGLGGRRIEEAVMYGGITLAVSAGAVAGLERQEPLAALGIPLRQPTDWKLCVPTGGIWWTRLTMQRAILRRCGRHGAEARNT